MWTSQVNGQHDKMARTKYLDQLCVVSNVNGNLPVLISDRQPVITVIKLEVFDLYTNMIFIGHFYIVHTIQVVCVIVRVVPGSDFSRHVLVVVSPAVCNMSIKRQKVYFKTYMIITTYSAVLF